MTDEKTARIWEAATIVQQKRDTFMALGMRNIAGRSPKERAEMAKEFAVAEAEMLEAETNYRKVVQP